MLIHQMLVNESSFQQHALAVLATCMNGPRMLCATSKSMAGQIFITNPKWDEIQHELFPRQEPHYRPDLIGQVFHQKLKRYVHQVTCICSSFLAHTTVRLLYHLFCVLLTMLVDAYANKRRKIPTVLAVLN